MAHNLSRFLGWCKSVKGLLCCYHMTTIMISQVISCTEVYTVDILAFVLGGPRFGESADLKKRRKKRRKKRASSQCVPHCTDFTYSALPTELSCLPGSLISKEHHSFLQQEGMKRRREEEGGNFSCRKLKATQGCITAENFHQQTKPT